MIKAIEAVGFACRLVVSLGFISAAVGKASHPLRFNQTLRGLKLPSHLATTLTWSIIAWELVTGATLLSGAIPLVGMLSAALLLGAFLIVSVIVKVRRLRVQCNCFGVSETLLGLKTAFRSLLLGTALAAWYFAFQTVGTSWWPKTMVEAIHALSVAAGLFLIGCWLLAISYLSAIVKQRAAYELAASGADAVRIHR